MIKNIFLNLYMENEKKEKLYGYIIFSGLFGFGFGYLDWFLIC